MKPKFLAVGVIVVILIIGAIALFSFRGTAAPQGSYTTAQTTVPQSNSSMLFSSTQYAPSSYQIFPIVNLSQNGKIATSDFKMATSQLQGGATLVYLNFTGTTTSYNVTVNAGYRIYYIDANLADDSPSHDANSGEDGYALVDPNGYVVSIKYPLPGA